jgi:hypothetical protein
MSKLISLVAKTISSVELVEIINEMREVGRAELRHDTFMEKIAKVLGSTAPEFSGTVARPQPAGGFRDYPCYRLPKREASLMVMSESYTVQAKVYDRMVELEAATPAVPTTFAAALRLAANQAETIETQALQLAAAQPAIEMVARYVEAKSSKCLSDVAKILGYKQQAFIALLNDDEVIFKRSGPWVP